jgi:flagellar hook protein FlgE
MTYFYVKDDPATAPNQWMMFASVDGKPIDLDDDPVIQAAADAVVVTATATVATAQAAYTATPNPTTLAALNTAKTALSTAISATTPESGTGQKGARLTFDSSGDFISQAPAPGDGGIRTVDFSDHLPNGADPSQAVKIDFNLDPLAPNPNEPTQFASNFEVTALEQDGLAVGRLTGIDIGTDGLVRATYSNGTSQPLARIAMVNFANNQGLTQIGSTNWKESIVSGEALAGEAGSGTFGTFNSSALEQSNVNLTTELIDLISAQRNFQANSRALEVDNQLNQTILQIR